MKSGEGVHEPLIWDATERGIFLSQWGKALAERLDLCWVGSGCSSQVL